MPAAAAASTQASKASPACKGRNTKPTLAARRSRTEANGDSGKQAGERGETIMQTTQHRADASCT